jgi:hypothetical protein
MTQKFLGKPISSLSSREQSMFNSCASSLYENEAIAKILHDTFIKPIRNVVLIDDEFDTFPELLEQKLESVQTIPPLSIVSDDDAPPPSFGKQEAETQKLRYTEQVFKIIKSCENDYLSYVDKRAEPSNGVIDNADLVILDYRLTSDSSAPQYSLKILKQLSKSHRMSLAAVYTQDEQEDVAKIIIIALRGYGQKGIVPLKCDNNTEKYETLLPYYLSSDYTGLQSIMKEQFDIKESEIDTIKRELEEFSRNKVVDFPQICTEKEGVHVFCGFPKNGYPWISCDNLFVVVVNKKYKFESIHGFIDCLKTSLIEAKPTPIRLIAQKCVTELVNQTPKIVDELFDDATTRSAVLFHNLTAEFPTAGGEERCYKLMARQLVTNIMESITANKLSPVVTDKISLVLSSILKVMNISRSGQAKNTTLELQKIIEAVQEYERAPQSSIQIIMLALNAFLCSEKPISDHLTTGTIFKISSNYWLCTSPSCDMIPRIRNTSCMRGHLKQANYFTACRLTKEKDNAIDDVLSKAENGRHIFIRLSAVSFLALSFSNEKSLLPSPFIFYTKNGGYIDSDKKIKICRIKLNKEGDFAIEEKDAAVIAQLKPAYASRFLQQVGLYNSRIGIDFRDMLLDESNPQV